MFALVTSLTGRSSGRQQGPWLRHFHGPCWCPTHLRCYGAAYLGVRLLFKQPLKWLVARLAFVHRPSSAMASQLSLSTKHFSSGCTAACQSSAASQNSQHRLPAPCACGARPRLTPWPSLPHIKALRLHITELVNGVHRYGSIWLSVLRLPAYLIAAPKCHTP